MGADLERVVKRGEITKAVWIFYADGSGCIDAKELTNECLTSI